MVLKPRNEYYYLGHSMDLRMPDKFKIQLTYWGTALASICICLNTHHIDLKPTYENHLQNWMDINFDHM